MYFLIRKLIIPALFFLAKTPMKIAVGTSLLIIASQSLIGFLGDLSSNRDFDWNLLFFFSLFSVVGIFIGNYISKFISGEKLKTGFGWFVFNFFWVDIGSGFLFHTAAHAEYNAHRYAGEEHTGAAHAHKREGQSRYGQ